MLHKHKAIDQEKLDWVNSKLDQLEQEAEHSFFTSRENDKENYVQFFDPVEGAIRSAWRGNIEPLKKLYPKLAPFLRPHKRLKIKGPRVDEVALVANDVKRIRDLWRKYPDQRIYRAGTDIEIAIDRNSNHSDQYENEVTIDAVLARLKPSGPKKRVTK
jgi:hypothetical protein